MRRVIGLVSLLFAAATIEARTDDKKAVPSLDGTYLIIGMEENGEKAPSDYFTKQPEADRTIVIKGDKLTAMRKGKEKSPLALKLDASKNPAEITMTDSIGDKPKTTFGIYTLEGDTLTICLVESDKAADRPKEFKTSKDSKAMILVLKKKEK
jgi:uncharacterized protein (TIGR03067 family)